MAIMGRYVITPDIFEILESQQPGAQGEIVPLDGGDFPGMPLLPTALAGTLCICPDALYEGFFVAKIRKKAKGMRH